jgi:hypothetical protein
MSRMPLLGELQQALEGAVFPLGRSELVSVARENDAPSAMLTLLEGLPAGEYAGYESVEAALVREETPADAEAPIGR